MGIQKRGLGASAGHDSEIAENDESDSEMSLSSDSSLDNDEDDDDDVDTEDEDDKDESEAENATAGVDDGVDEEDELVKAIKLAKEKVRDHPPNINVEDTIVDICFNPVSNLLAVGTIGGDALLYSYSDEANTLQSTFEVHSDACRDVEFDQTGRVLYSVGKDKHIMLTDTETGKLKAYYNDAHEVPIYCIRVLNDNCFVTGDDDGIVRLWDWRHRPEKPIFSIKLSQQYISDMITNTACKYLVCSSGDGALSTINMNARKIYVQTEEYESEFTCMGLFKHETKILAGSSNGKMYIFNWGEFGAHSDEYAGLKQSISCMVPVTENIVVMSGEDGVLRAVHLFPHKQLGVVGQHSIDVDNIDISNNGHYLASHSHDNDIKFWNILYFDEVEVHAKKQNKRRDIRNNLPSSKIGNASDFFAGMS